MISYKLDKLISENSSQANDLISLKLGDESLRIYQNSIFKKDVNYLFIAKGETEKSLYIISPNSNNEIFSLFKGNSILTENDISIKKCKLDHTNAEAIKKIFNFANPVVVGLQNSFGFGDRLGLANPAHIRSLKANEDFFPILAQQSIRELTRTERTPDEVMDVAIWSVLQEGYTNGYGADADHLKTTDDVDLMAKAGYKMFTFDPGDHVVNEADTMSENEAEIYISRKELLSDANIIAHYTNKEFVISEYLTLSPTTLDIMRALVKYGSAIDHIKKMFKHLEQLFPDGDFEVEVSVDETDSVTSPFEHFFIANELIKAAVKIVSLAPRFIGDFEKGIDYRGDLEIFKQEYLKHIAIANYFGTYKISLHSGSDKFGVYHVIGQLNKGYTHVKTAGTSYLEALRVVANAESQLFREILDFARDNFKEQKKTYHVSADLRNVKSSDSYNDEELLDLLNQDDTRQVLHVTFGLVLTVRDKSDNCIYKNRIMDCLNSNEELHNEYLTKHFGKHLRPFVNKLGEQLC